MKAPGAPKAGPLQLPALVSAILISVAANILCSPIHAQEEQNIERGKIAVTATRGPEALTDAI